MRSNSILDDSNPAVHRGLPSYFRATCFRASRGEDGGYFGVGRVLASKLTSEMPYGLEFDDECQPEVEKLEQVIDADDDEAIWRWFKSHFPRFMALVPTRRKQRFIAGVKEVYWEDGFMF